MEPQTVIQPPTIGRIVLFESATGSGVKYPAIVIRTRASTDPEIIERWGPNPQGETIEKPEGLVADLPNDHTVDLHIFGLASSFREYAVPHPAVQDQTPTSGLTKEERAKSPTARTWDWPPRIPTAPS